MKIGFIGSGNMGSALASAAARASGTEVMIYDKDAEKAKAVAEALGASYASLEKISAECDFVFLGVKPNIICSVADGLKDKLSEKAVVVSMAAGVKIAKIASHLKLGTPIIRIMPNTPVSVGAGMILWCANEGVTEKTSASFVATMSSAGCFDKIDEEKIDAASAVSGCGPAFMYMFLEAMVAAGEKLGLDGAQARTYAQQTMIGAATLAASSPETLEALRVKVCSPGGSTIEGVKKFQTLGLSDTVEQALGASYRRTLELGKK